MSDYNQKNTPKKTQRMLYYGLIPFAICLESFMGEFNAPTPDWRVEIFYATLLLAISATLVIHELKFRLCAIVLTSLYFSGFWKLTAGESVHLSVTLQSSWMLIEALPAAAGVLATGILWMQRAFLDETFSPRSAAVLAGWTGYFLLALARAGLGFDHVEQASVLHHAAAGGLALAAFAGLLLPDESSAHSGEVAA